MIPESYLHRNDKLLELPAFITDAFAKSSLTVIYRNNNSDAWNHVLNNTGYVPFAYLENTIHFQIALQTGNGISLSDLSVIVLYDNKPCAVWPLLFRKEPDHAVLSGFGTMLLPPLFISGIASVSKKHIIKECIKVIEEIGRQAEINTIQSEEPFLNTKNISDWHYELIRKGAVAVLRYDLYVNLSLDIEKIKSRFRKSYKSLISRGLKAWKVEKLENDDPAIWEEFRQLHIKVAGRETRSKESWAIHYEAVMSGMAFLIYLRNDAGEMVGGGLFIHSGQECFYGVGAYDRSLFDKPLGHVVQYVAIEEMQKRGLLWYKVGTRAFATDIPTPSDKEVSITEFKEGFATDIFPKYLLAMHI